MSNLDQRHNILEMNDDCFYQVFKNLDFIDWCALRETCTRFRSICDYLFERSVGSFKLEPAKRNTGRQLDLFELKDAKCIIRNFGKFMTKVSIVRDYFGEDELPSKLVPVLQRYCHALKDLEFVKVELDAATIVECERLFSNLNRLVIYKISKETYTRLVAHWKSLKELTLNEFVCINEFLVPESTSLESFTMTHCWGPSINFFNQFFAMNPQLKRVTILNNLLRMKFMEREILSIDLPNLESLSLECTFNFQLIVPHIPSLKKVELLLNCLAYHINGALTDLAVRNNIEHLHLAEVVFDDDLIQRLCAMKTLEILKFSQATRLDGNKCKKLACELPDLSEIHINQCADTTFNEIKEFVAHSNNLKRIVFNRPKDSQQPSLTEVTVSSLVKARQKMEAKETLMVFLNHSDLRDIQIGFERMGISKMLLVNNQYRIPVIKLLPALMEE